MTMPRAFVAVAFCASVACSSNESASPDGGSAADASGSGGASSAGGAISGGAGAGDAGRANGGTMSKGGGANDGRGGSGGRSTSASGGAGANTAGAGAADTGDATTRSDSGAPFSFKCADAAPNVTAPPATWANATGNLANMQSECGNLGLVSANPCSDMVIAGVAKAGLWATEDGGKTWKKLGSGQGSAVITNRISAIVYDPSHPGTFWESGIYNGGGVYRTTDNGETFVQLGDVTHDDSVSVDFTDPDRKTLLAGPHEATSKLFRSTDGGKTWTDIGKMLPSSAGYCTATQILGATDLLVGCAGGGVFHSTDGNSWTPVGSKGVEPQPLLASDGTLYWPGSQGGVEVSADHGQHFTETADGNLAPGIVGSASPAELPDGRIVIIGKDHLLISSDKGKSWKPIGEPLPYPGGGYDGARGPAYSARTKTFFIWRWDCGSNVLPNAVMSAGFDWSTQ
jgi:photosystem II stability/assembly factor-like uncharacterized protein